MTVRRNVMAFTVALVFCAQPGAYAEPVSLVDTTPGTATRDGSVGPGEYVAFSSGINSDFGDVMGTQSLLHVDSSLGGKLNFGLASGGGSLNNFGVIYIDSVAGGVDGTAGLTDTIDVHRRMISGTSPASSADLSFAPGFKADYAIAFNSGYGGLWQIKAGGSNAPIASVDFVPLDDAGGASWELELDLSDIGLLPGQAFKYVTSYADVTAYGGDRFYRSGEFHGVAGSTVSGGSPGTNAVVLASGDYNTFRTYGSAPDPGPVTIKDRTAEGATVDGTIGNGEYAGFSVGINNGFGNVFGDQSQVYVDSSVDGALNFGFRKGPGGFGLPNTAVIYIDSVDGGPTGTVTLLDTYDSIRRMITGENTGGKSHLVFAPGFAPDYAVGMDSGGGFFAGLYRLVKFSSLVYEGALTRAQSGNDYELSLSIADIGVERGDTIRYLVTYGNPDDGNGPFRSDEFHGVAGSSVTTGNPGTNTVVLSAGDYNTFTTIDPADLATILTVK